MNAAYAANEREGAEIATRYGGVDDYDWMYYNSDYYYKEEDMRNSIRQTIHEMSREWETRMLILIKWNKVLIGTCRRY